ncbi:MAG: phage terminase large subunit [Anaerolineales bacterium]|nr:phage terminase large subunit [Anaerolineales bacterium]
MLAQPTSQALSPEAAKREVARRELARRSLTAFGEYISPWYSTQPFHRLIDKELEDIERYVRTRGRQGNGRLIINMPPQNGKSEKASKIFPAWFLGRNPDDRVIIASYGSELAFTNSAGVRAYIRDARYANVFGERSSVDLPVGLDSEQGRVGGWDLGAPHRGGLTAAGVGGPLTGKGAHLAVIDDPFKDRSEAESPAARRKVLDWWSGVLVQRLRQGAAIVLLMTRWHPDDLAGHLLKEMAFNPEADKYRVLSLPALAAEPSQLAKNEDDQRAALSEGLWLNIKDPLGRQPGEALWPGMFPREDRLRAKANMAAYDWEALHMQMPRPRTGGFFAREWRIVEPSEVPSGLQWFRHWDLATSESARADYTCGASLAFDANGVLYIRDVRRWRTAWPESRRNLVQLSAEVDPAEIWGMEHVSFQLAAVQDMQRELAGRRSFYPVKPEGSKQERALPLQNLNDMGRVVLVRGAWNRDFVSAGNVFPRQGEHDDEIDSVTGAMQLQREYDQRHRVRGRALLGFA